MIIKIISFFLFIFILNINDTECDCRKLWLVGCLRYNGNPAKGATVYVNKKYFLGISQSLTKFNSDNRGCFDIKAKGYVSSKYDLYITIKYSYPDRWWLCNIRASLIFPMKITTKCANKDKIADLGRLDLITVSGVEKTCQPIHRIKKKKKNCRIKIN
uniref:Uncharacterized protein n=1 Tax=Strongyloides venezuelensis TaxID=75913 RepID=A0A0K0F1A4_STRVS